MDDRVSHTNIAYTVFIVALASLLTATVAYDVYAPDYFRTVAPEMLRGTVIVFGLVSVYLGLKLRQLSKLNQQLELLVARDNLTDVATRDFFFTALAAQPERDGVCLMVDIDHFKRINDTHGHLVGDKVIANVARHLRHSVRNDDIVCRFGGEEFAIFLADADADRALEISERVRKSIAKHHFDAGECQVAVTVSIGGSTVMQARDAESAIHQADIALYQAKRNGRNQTVFANADTCEMPAELDQAA
ncbi:MAG: GGDEF domain-containing protein [Pseudomonadota bacterium]